MARGRACRGVFVRGGAQYGVCGGGAARASRVDGAGGAGGAVEGSWFSEEERGWLGRECGEEDEGKAAEWVLRVLEGEVGCAG